METGWDSRTIFKESYETVTQIYIVKGKEWLHLFIQVKNKQILNNLYTHRIFLS